MDGRRGARQIIDFIDFDIERQSDVVADKFKARLAVEMVNIAFCASEKIIDAEDLMTLGYKLVCKM